MVPKYTRSNFALHFPLPLRLLNPIRMSPLSLWRTRREPHRPGFGTLSLSIGRSMGVAVGTRFDASSRQHRDGFTGCRLTQPHHNSASDLGTTSSNRRSDLSRRSTIGTATKGDLRASSAEANRSSASLFFEIVINSSLSFAQNCVLDGCKF